MCAFIPAVKFLSLYCPFQLVYNVNKLIFVFFFTEDMLPMEVELISSTTTQMSEVGILSVTSKDRHLFKVLSAVFKIHISMILATYFMTYHTIMTENEDYIEGLKMARKIGDNITNTLRTMLHNDNIKVFPYR